jgi:hypothetical protein
MTTRYLIIAAIPALIAACSVEVEDNSKAVLEEYEHGLAEVTEALDVYIAGVDAAADLPAVDALQTTYSTDVGHAMEELEHLLEEIDGCEHDNGGGALVPEASASMVVIGDAIDGLLSGHDTHGDVGECVIEAGAHETVVLGETEAMSGHHDAWGGAMHCAHHDDEDAEPHKD